MAVAVDALAAPPGLAEDALHDQAGAARRGNTPGKANPGHLHAGNPRGRGWIDRPRPEWDGGGLHARRFRGVRVAPQPDLEEGRSGNVGCHSEHRVKWRRPLVETDEVGGGGRRPRRRHDEGHRLCTSFGVRSIRRPGATPTRARSGVTVQAKERWNRSLPTRCSRYSVAKRPRRTGAWSANGRAAVAGRPRSDC